jgi:thiol-disulfide isomerase/thioredoxin
MKRGVIFGYGTLLLIGVLTFGSCRKEPAAAAVNTDPKPSKSFAKDGVTVKAYDFRSFKSFLEKDNDTTYVVNFWATWCEPCVAELPNFEKLGNDYKNQKVKVILTSLDFQKQVEKSLIPFINKHKLRSKVVLLSDPDANSWISQVGKNWSGALPGTLIYNKKKNLRKFYEKSFSYDELQTEVKPFIQ